MTTPSNTDDVIDSHDVDSRIEELEGEREHLADKLEAAEECVRHHHDDALDPDGPNTEHAEYRRCRDELAAWDSGNTQELEALKAFRDELQGYCDWRHGATLIREDYFETYARELAEDICGAELRAAKWPLSCIDWEKAADELQTDYTSGEFNGVTYWVR